MDAILDGMKNTKEGDFESGHLETGLEEGTVSFMVNEDLALLIGTEYSSAQARALAAEAQYREAL